MFQGLKILAYNRDIQKSTKEFLTLTLLLFPVSYNDMSCIIFSYIPMFMVLSHLYFHTSSRKSDNREDFLCLLSLFDIWRDIPLLGKA
jgi:hypothetical protein